MLARVYKKKNSMPVALGDDDKQIQYETSRNTEKTRRSKQEKEKIYSKQWIENKNQLRLKQGKVAREHQSKYSGQKRKNKF